MPRGSKQDESQNKEGAETSASTDPTVGKEDVSQGNVRNEERQESANVLVGSSIKPRKGMTVFYNRGREVCPAIIINVLKDEVIDLSYFSTFMPGRCITQSKISKGLNVNQWWPDLDEAEAGRKLDVAKCLTVA